VAIHDIVALTYYLENFDKSVINPDSLLIQVSSSWFALNNFQPRT
jgi:hypothetical protein